MTWDLVDAAVGKIDRSQLLADGTGGCTWVERRPDRGGQSVFMRRTALGEVAQLGPSAWSLTSSIGGYGGRSYARADGGWWVVVGSNHDLYWLSDNGDERLFSRPSDGSRIGDLAPTQHGCVLVREFGEDPVERSLAFVSSDGTWSEIYSGPDFVSNVCIDESKGAMAWVEWDHPNLPWDGARLMIANFEDGAVTTPQCLAGGSGEPAYGPTFDSVGTLRFVAFNDGWLRPFQRTSRGEVVELSTENADFADPPWTSTNKTLLGLPDGSTLAAVRREGVHVLEVLGEHSVSFKNEAVAVRDLCLVGGQVLGLIATWSSRADLVRVDLASGTLVHLIPQATLPGSVRRPSSLPLKTPTGRQIEGFFAAPIEQKSASLPPVIVFCHGGPTDCVDPSLDPTVQVFLDRGYAVALVNYRGSTGFGTSYRAALDGQWGVVDVDDVVAYRDALEREGLVDGRACFVRGASSGGLTALRALESGRFLGGTGIYPCSNLERLAEVTHDFESRYLDRLIGPLPDALALYEERSPALHPERIQGGLLLLQGLDDVVVPASQTEELAAALTELGRPPTVVYFPGEGHGFRQKASIVVALEAELAHYESLLTQERESQ
ncbi:MAG: prolyl oligopeptidase family serine peptidase [Actinomycetota bacterium]